MRNYFEITQIFTCKLLTKNENNDNIKIIKRRNRNEFVF